MILSFSKRKSVLEVEEGNSFQPKFDEHGLIPVVTVDKNNNILMHGYMNSDALKKSIETKSAYYWSRSRNCLWKKGETSGLTQDIIEIRVDDDQDCIWMKVNVNGNGASCHVGYKSCFYRKLSFDKNSQVKLIFTEKKKVFEPKKVYGDIPNPTKL